MGLDKSGLFVDKVPLQIQRLKGGRMHITVSGILTLLVPVGVWVIAAAIANDEG